MAGFILSNWGSGHRLRELTPEEVKVREAEIRRDMERAWERPGVKDALRRARYFVRAAWIEYE